MQDKASSQGHPPCPSLATSLLWLDYLDLPGSPREQPLSDLSRQDLQQVLSAQQHVLSCSYCPSLIRRERSQRALQRSSLQSLLHDGEQVVPSTVSQILSALSREPLPNPSLDPPPLEVGSMLPLAHLHDDEHRPSLRPRHLLRSTFALVAALILVLTGFGIFQQITTSVQLHPSTAAKPSSPLLPTPPARVLTADWNSFVLTRPSPDGKTLLVENYDPLQQRSTLLLSVCCSPDVSVDGVSHAGDDLLYHQFSQGQTTYSLLSGQRFTVHGQGSNAIWSTDDHFIYVSVDQDLLQYDVHLHTQKKLTLSSHSTVTRLQFYYNQYLYFSSARSTVGTDLYRVNLSTGGVQLLTESLSSTSNSADFWLSPSGTTIYYMNVVAGENSIFSINLDGSNQSMIAANATPIGYAADTTLIALREVQGKFQLVKLTTPQQVIVADLAPGALTLPAYNVALAPYAGAVVVAGLYNDGSLQLWSTNVTTFAQQTLLSLSATQQSLPVHLIGWDRLRVPA
jgi:hypothetical protein